MRGLILFATIALPSAALAQADPRDLFENHPPANTGNGAARIGRRMDGPVDHRPATAPPALSQPENSGVHVYKPRPLNDLAREIAGKPH